MTTTTTTMKTITTTTATTTTTTMTTVPLTTTRTMTEAVSDKLSTLFFSFSFSFSLYVHSNTCLQVMYMKIDCNRTLGPQKLCTGHTRSTNAARRAAARSVQQGFIDNGSRAGQGRGSATQQQQRLLPQQWQGGANDCSGRVGV